MRWARDARLAMLGGVISQRKPGTFTRTVASTTLDGRRLTAEVSVALGGRPSEELAGQVVRIVDEILSSQIVQGQKPLTAEELELMTLERTTMFTKAAQIRVVNLRLSVAPSARAESMRPAPSQLPPPRPSTIVPVSRPAMQSGARPSTPSPSSAAAPQAPARPSIAPWLALGTQPVQSFRPSAAPPASNPPPTVRVPLPERLPQAAPSSSRPSAAPEASVDLEAFGARVAPSLREAAGRTVLALLSGLSSAKVDVLSLLGGASPADELGKQATACLAASIYRTFRSRGESHKVSAARVETACRHAFPDARGPSGADIGSFIATDAAPSELAVRLAQLLGCEGDAHVVRAAVANCQAAFGERLAVLD